jgi:hypothetical protein
MSGMISIASDETLTLFTQFFDVLAIFVPLIEKLNNTNLTNLLVTPGDTDATVQLTQELQEHFSEPKHHFHEFV